MSGSIVKYGLLILGLGIIRETPAPKKWVMDTVYKVIQGNE